MSIRTLVEINHDYAHDLAEYMKDGDFDKLLLRFIRGGDLRARKALPDVGIRVISQRHHADNYYINEREEGFPARYVDRAAQEKARDE